jgi:chromosome segregation ATPase
MKTRTTKTLVTLSSSALSLVLLAGCATDPSNDPHTGGFFGGVHGLASGDYDARQQGLEEQRGESLNQLRALREEGSYLEDERAMKADDVAAQRRQLASLKARNRALANRINQLRYAKNTTEQQTEQLRRKQQQLTGNIQQFESELERGQLTAAQANAKQLSLERQYDAIKDL